MVNIFNAYFTQILLVWTPAYIHTTSAGIQRPRQLSRIASAVLTSTPDSPPTALLLATILLVTSKLVQYGFEHYIDPHHQMVSLKFKAHF